MTTETTELQTDDVTQLLAAYRAGHQDALSELGDRLYPELKAMARRRAANANGMGATTLVQETFLKLLSGSGLQAQDRNQFFGLAATVMRRVIVDEVRYAMAQKRHGNQTSATVGALPDEMQVDAEFMLQLDQALDSLSRSDHRLVQVFECRYFGGYSTAETAEILELSQRSVERLWASARRRVGAAFGH